MLKSWWFYILLWLIGALVVFGAVSLAKAEDFTDTQAIQCIVGEASNQGYQGMLAIACAIRNRDTLKGVYGLNAKHKEPQWVYDMAQKAWKESKNKDIANGATNWENIKAFGEPYWVKSMVEVYRYKDHIFYKKKGGKK